MCSFTWLNSNKLLLSVGLQMFVHVCHAKCLQCNSMAWRSSLESYLTLTHFRCSWPSHSFSVCELVSLKRCNYATLNSQLQLVLSTVCGYNAIYNSSKLPQLREIEKHSFIWGSHPPLCCQDGKEWNVTGMWNDWPLLNNMQTKGVHAFSWMFSKWFNISKWSILGIRTLN